MIVLEIPRATPSLNATRRRHWSVVHREKQLWAWEVRVALEGQPRYPPPSRARVTIERRGHRALDPDNLVGGFKALIDALRAERLIVDDDPTHLELVPRQAKGTPLTIVTVEAA